MATPFDVPLAQLRTRQSLKWRTYAPDVLPMFVAEMDVSALEPVVRAVHDAMAAGDTGYDHGTRYAEAFAGFARERHGWDVPVAGTRMVPDVMIGIVEVLGVLTHPGDAVVITTPVYPPFRAFLEHAGLHVVAVPLTEAGRLDLDALDAAFVDARAMLLCHPQNPTGTLHSAAELTALGELAARHHVRVVSDEIHAPLVLDDEPFVSATAVIPQAVALHSASKAFNLAGLKAAVAVPGAEAGADLARMPEIVGHGVSQIGVVAHVAAYREGGAWLDSALEQLRSNVATVDRTLADRLPGARWTPPASTYFAWLDLRGCVPSDADPARVLLQEAALAVNSGPTFGAQGAGFVRMNLATSSDVLAEGLDRLVRALG